MNSRIACAFLVILVFVCACSRHAQWLDEATVGAVRSAERIESFSISREVVGTESPSRAELPPAVGFCGYLITRTGGVFEGPAVAHLLDLILSQESYRTFSGRTGNPVGDFAASECLRFRGPTGTVRVLVSFERQELRFVGQDCSDLGGGRFAPVAAEFQGLFRSVVDATSAW